MIVFCFVFQNLVENFTQSSIVNLFLVLFWPFFEFIVLFKLIYILKLSYCLSLHFLKSIFLGRLLFHCLEQHTSHQNCVARWKMRRNMQQNTPSAKLVSLSNDTLTQLLLYGDQDLSNDLNRNILELTLRFIHGTDQFD